MNFLPLFDTLFGAENRDSFRANRVDGRIPVAGSGAARIVFEGENRLQCGSNLLHMAEDRAGGILAQKIFEIESLKTPSHGHLESKIARKMRKIYKKSKNAPNYKIFFALFNICEGCNIKQRYSFKAYRVETVACAHTCTTGTYSKRSHKNSHRFQKQPVLLASVTWNY